MRHSYWCVKCKTDRCPRTFRAVQVPTQTEQSAAPDFVGQPVDLKCSLCGNTHTYTVENLIRCPDGQILK